AAERRSADQQRRAVGGDDAAWRDLDEHPVGALADAHDAAELAADRVAAFDDRAAGEDPVSLRDPQDADLRADDGRRDRAIDPREARALRPRDVAGDANGDVLRRDRAEHRRARSREDAELRDLFEARHGEAEAARSRRQLG